MSRWLSAAIILLLLCGARSFICAQDSSLASDSTVVIRNDSARADTSRQAVVAAFTSFGFWIYENMRNTWLYWAYKLRPVTRTVKKIWHNLLYSPDNSIISTPLSKRK